MCLRTSITEIRAFFLDSRWLYGLSPSRICATCRRAWETGRRIPRCLKVKATAHSHVKWDTPCRQIICRLVRAVGCASELPCFRTGGFHGPPYALHLFGCSRILIPWPMARRTRRLVTWFTQGRHSRVTMLLVMRPRPCFNHQIRILKYQFCL